MRTVPLPIADLRHALVAARCSHRNQPLRRDPSPDRPVVPRSRRLVARTVGRYGRQAGTTTAEYAIGTLAACGFAALLYKIVTSGSVSALLSGIIHKALGAVG